MKKLSVWILCGSFCGFSARAEPIPVAKLERTDAVDFAREIAPILRDNCQACHNASKAKAGLSLETPASILKGGESGPAAVPGKGTESLLVKSASHAAEPFMPPSGNQAGAKDLTGAQLGLLKLWIDQGATGQVELAVAPLKWQALPAGFHPINAVALSPDGQYAACGRGGRVAVYRLTTGEMIELEAHRDVVQSLAFSPDGSLLASGGYRAIKLWRRTGPRMVKELAPNELQVAGGEGRTSAGLEAKLTSGKTVAELTGDRHATEQLAAAERTAAFAKAEVAFHKTGLESAEKADKTEQETLKKARELKEAADKALAQAIASTNSANQGLAQARRVHEAAAGSAKLAAQNRDAAAKLIELAAEQLRTASNQLARISSAAKEAQAAREAAVTAAIKAGAEAQVAADSAEKRKWAEQAMDGAAAAKAALEAILQEENSAKQVLTRLAEIAKQHGEARAAGEKILADAQGIEKERLAEVQKAEKLLAENVQALERATAAKAKEADNLEFATKAAAKAGEALKSAKESLVRAEAASKAAEEARAAAAKNEQACRVAVVSGAFSEDGKLAATVDASGRVALWDAQSGAALEAFQAKGERVEFAGTNLIVARGGEAALWNLGGDWILERTIGSEDDSSPIADRVLALDFSPDGKRLASGGGMPSRSGEIMVWDVANGSLARNFKDPHSDTVNALDFSADGQRLASGGADKFARIFEAESGTLVRSLEGHTHHVLGVSWKRDGRTLASAGADKVVKLWNTATGEQRKTIEGFGKEVNSVHFLDASGEALVTSGDPLVRLVREDGNNNVRNFEGASDFVSAGGVTPDGHWVAAGGSDGILRIWDGRNGKLARSFGPAPGALLTRGGL